MKPRLQKGKLSMKNLSKLMRKSRSETCASCSVVCGTFDCLVFIYFIFYDVARQALQMMMNQTSPNLK